MGLILKADGNWYEGKAGPKLLDATMRDLPGDLVTDDIDDPDKIYESDHSHVRETLIDDYKERALDPDMTLEQALDAFEDFPVNVDVPLNQRRIDKVIFKVYASLLMKVTIESMPFEVHKMRHIMFERDSVNCYELRAGWAPPDSKRKSHVRGYNLNIDMTQPPQEIVAFFNNNGFNVPVLQKEDALL